MGSCQEVGPGGNHQKRKKQKQINKKRTPEHVKLKAVLATAARMPHLGCRARTTGQSARARSAPGLKRRAYLNSRSQRRPIAHALFRVRASRQQKFPRPPPSRSDPEHWPPCLKLPPHVPHLAPGFLPEGLQPFFPPQRLLLEAAHTGGSSRHLTRGPAFSLRFAQAQ